MKIGFVSVAYFIIIIVFVLNAVDGYLKLGQNILLPSSKIPLAIGYEKRSDILAVAVQDKNTSEYSIIFCTANPLTLAFEVELANVRPWLLLVRPQVPTKRDGTPYPYYAYVVSQQQFLVVNLNTIQSSQGQPDIEEPIDIAYAHKQHLAMVLYRKSTDYFVTFFSERAVPGVTFILPGPAVKLVQDPVSYRIYVALAPETGSVFSRILVYEEVTFNDVPQLIHEFKVCCGVVNSMAVDYTNSRLLLGFSLGRRMLAVDISPNAAAVPAKLNLGFQVPLAFIAVDHSLGHYFGISKTNLTIESSKRNNFNDKRLPLGLTPLGVTADYSTPCLYILGQLLTNFNRGTIVEYCQTDFQNEGLLELIDRSRKEQPMVDTIFPAELQTIRAIGKGPNQNVAFEDWWQDSFLLEENNGSLSRQFLLLAYNSKTLFGMDPQPPLVDPYPLYNLESNWPTFDACDNTSKFKQCFNYLGLDYQVVCTFDSGWMASLAINNDLYPNCACNAPCDEIVIV